MISSRSDRRRFLQRAARGAVAAGWLSAGWGAAGGAESAAGPGHAVRLGGLIFSDSADPEELALAHRKLGYRAAYCPKVKLDDTHRIRAISAAFAKHGVMIAEVGRWLNLLDADAKKRAANLQKVTEGLALAEAVGAHCCVDIAGSFNPTSWYGPHPDNLSPKFLDAIVENARKIIDAVKPRRAKFTYEAMGWSIPDNPDSYLRLIKAVDREGFGVHLDPCNMVNCPSRFYDTTALLNECFDKLGPWIVSCHAKDIAWADPVELQVHIVETLPGTGVLDYATFLKRLSTLPRDVPLMQEHLQTAEEFAKARQYIMETGRRAGVSFEGP